MMTGTFPIDGRTFEEIAEQHKGGRGRRLRDLRSDLPDGFLDAIDCALARDPAGRFATTEDLGAAIGREGL